MYYRIFNNKLYDYSDNKYNDDCLITNIITQHELDEHSNKVIVQNGILIINPNYEEEEAEKEVERVGNLQCTKRVFVLMLEELQLNYFEQILPVIEANRQAKLEWELCEKLQRKNPLIDQIASQFGITSEQLDNLFKYANGEITLEQFKGEE